MVCGDPGQKGEMMLEKWKEMLSADDVAELLENMEEIEKRTACDGCNLFFDLLRSGLRFYRHAIEGAQKEETLIYRLRQFRAWRDLVFASV